MHHDTTHDSVQFPQNINPAKKFLYAGIAGLLVSLAGYFADHDQFFYSYLTSFSFVASFAIGSLFLVMIHHITRSSWAITLRRIPETVASNLVWVGVMFIPVLFGMHSLYHWTHEDAVATDALLQGKAPYLNVPFFIVRNVIYFSFWGFLGYKLYKNTIALDNTNDWSIETKQRKISAPGLFLFGFSVAFASFDWLMSLDPHWFSTMFGVYYFAMSFQAVLAAMVLLALYLRGKGLLVNTIQTETYSTLGKLLFGFTVFYAYIAFSQFFLIYYANIPEETLWFYHRLEGGWQYVTYGLLISRFIIPFFLLLPASSKKNLGLLKFMAVWVIVVHFIEQYWVVMPNRGLTNPDFHYIAPHWMDLTTLIGLVGISLWLFFDKFGKASMVCVNDPKFHESQHSH
jgi:hypothetical protein